MCVCVSVSVCVSESFGFTSFSMFDVPPDSLVSTGHPAETLDASPASTIVLQEREVDRNENVNEFNVQEDHMKNKSTSQLAMEKITEQKTSHPAGLSAPHTDMDLGNLSLDANVTEQIDILQEKEDREEGDPQLKEVQCREEEEEIQETMATPNDSLSTVNKHRTTAQSPPFLPSLPQPLDSVIFRTSPRPPSPTYHGDTSPSTHARQLPDSHSNTGSEGSGSGAWVDELDSVPSVSTPVISPFPANACNETTR